MGYTRWSDIQGGRVLKDIPHLGIYKTFVLDRGRVLKDIPLIEGINTRGQKSMVFRVNWAVSGIKSPSTMICSGIQIRCKSISCNFCFRRQMRNIIPETSTNVVDASSMRRRCVVDMAGAWRLVNAKNKDFINFAFWGEPFWGKSYILIIWIPARSGGAQ